MNQPEARDEVLVFERARAESEVDVLFCAAPAQQPQ